jgi:XTP/dITP diphosphohydrolase
MAKLEQALISGKDRSAYFETAISLILDDEEHVFVGRVNGHISSERRGGEGFGYDPIFIPEGQTLTFAEMELHQKNQMSHRARAFKKMVDFLAERMK